MYTDTRDSYLRMKNMKRLKSFQNIQRNKKKSSNNNLIVLDVKDLYKTASDYSQSSSLHGLRYVGNKDLHVTERVFWVLSFLMAILTSIYFITNLLQKWYEMPVIMSLSPRSIQLTSIPFPAITICNMNNARKSVAEEVMRSRYDNVERKLLDDICDTDTFFQNETTNVAATSWNRIQRFMVKVSQPCYEMITACKWHGEMIDCDKIFNSALTDEGMCCVFNNLKFDHIFRNPRDASDLNNTFPFPTVDWTPENGYPENSPVESLPRRPWGAGSHLGLTIQLNTELEQYYCASEKSQGFKMVLHNPVEVPRVSGYSSLICPGMETQVIVKPVISSSTPLLRTIETDQRQCVFSNEKILRYYRTYTQKNCVLECEANFTLKICQCVMYYMPKDHETRVCGRKDVPCANRAKLIMESRLRDDASNSSYMEDNKNTYRPSCGCLPGCSSLLYEKVISSSVLSFQTSSQLNGSENNFYVRNNMAIVHFFFTESQFTGIIKGELFGFTEFLSSTGGLLGLFMGFSFLSVVEAIYFLTLRLWCSIHQRKKTSYYSKRKTNNGIRTAGLIHVQHLPFLK